LAGRSANKHLIGHTDKEPMADHPWDAIEHIV
jgi:hypothetical protein